MPSAWREEAQGGPCRHVRPVGDGRDGHLYGMPLDDALEVLRRGLEVAVAGMLRTLDDRLGDRRDGGEVHVRYPHGDGVKTFLRCARAIPPAPSASTAIASWPFRSISDSKSYFISASACLIFLY